MNGQEGKVGDITEMGALTHLLVMVQKNETV